MHLIHFDTPQQFYDATRPWLVQHEAQHNLILGLTTSLMHGSSYGEFPPYLALVKEAEEIVAVAFRTPPRDLILSQVTTMDALLLIAADVFERYGRLPGLVGLSEVAEAFVKHWEPLSGQVAALAVHERIYKLAAVTPVNGVSGQMRPATPADREVLTDWMLAFNREALPHMTMVNMAATVDRYLASDPKLRGLVLWEHHGQPVSMAGYAGPTPNGIRISSVYTPPEHRQHGYASACVAALSRQLLDEGRRFCFLFTDLSNPTSNHIYQQIGYRPVCDVYQYQFT